MKKTFTYFLCVVLLFSLCSCSVSDKKTTTAAENTASQPSAASQSEAKQTTKRKTGTFAPVLEAVPDEYVKPLENTLPTVEISYTHKDHTKHAVVYLPPDYDESERYNIVYLIAGRSADHTAFFNEAGSPAVLKNIFDHMIANKEIEPFIAVNLAFYPDKNTNLENSSVKELLDDFNEELRTVIIPSVESKFSTYADGVSAKAISKSREHRAFAGFSLGGGVCWNTLANDLDYFRYFAPMAAGSLDDYLSNGGVAAVLERNMQALGYSEHDFFVFATEGTNDVTYKKMQKLIKKFKKKYPHLFIFTDSDTSEGNITYKMKQGGEHRYKYAYEYIYNSLRAFWE